MIFRQRTKFLIPKQHSELIKVKNVEKHLRIARATKGHEKEVHIAAAEKLIKRYGFPPLDRRMVNG